MHIVVITLAPTLTISNKLCAYAPYVREMDLWFKHVNTVTIVSPTSYSKNLLTASFNRQDIEVVDIPSLSFNTAIKALVSFISLPVVMLRIFREMRKAGHIHLRCPGNIGLLGALVQILFPKKVKTTKYAGNWDPKAKQPLSYKLQKWILSNTRLTKNMTVLVYGDWPNQSKNIQSFFTASYLEKDKNTCVKNFNGSFKFMFVGSLVAGKRPEYAVKLVTQLYNRGLPVTLDIYGDGNLREILAHKLTDYIKLHGNKDAVIVKEAYKEAHFLILASKSEGWPKVVAEAMFHGAVPLVTPISCVPWMLGKDKRGMLLSLNLENDVQAITRILEHKDRYDKISEQAQKWSQNYTLERFENEIKVLLP